MNACRGRCPPGTVHITDPLGRRFTDVARVIVEGVEEVSIVRWTVSLAILAWCAVPAAAQSSIQTAFNYNLAEEEAAAKPAEEASEKPACGCAEPSCEAEASCGCESGCCNSGCGGSGWGNCLGDCCLGEAWSLQSYLQPCCDKSTTYGGWVSAGYYSDNERFSFQPNDLLSFHDNPDNLNLDQAWLYVEKLADTDSCCPSWGYRGDIVYGVDAQKTQAFGNADNVWDVSLDHGSYGWAMPQAYAELGYNGWSVKMGHFFTPMGYEVVPATGNFFYSHSYTFFNSEPFTHTGVLGTYTANDRLTIYTGWTLGWDTGFDQNDGGSNFLGGFGYQLNDCVKYTYICTAGDLGFRGDGYSHTNVLDMTLSSRWHYVLASDYVDTDLEVEDGAENLDYGLVNYLFYTLNDCWSVGGRAEWWKSNTLLGESSSFYEITGGLNYHAHANLVIRPEVRYNWTPSEDAVDDEIGEDFNQFVFGVDAVLKF